MYIDVLRYIYVYTRIYTATPLERASQSSGAFWKASRKHRTTWSVPFTFSPRSQRHLIAG